MPNLFKTCVGAGDSEDEVDWKDLERPKPSLLPKTDGESVDDWILRIEKFVSDERKTVWKEKIANKKKIKFLKAELEEEKRVGEEMENIQIYLERRNGTLKQNLESLKKGLERTVGRIEELERKVFGEPLREKMARIRSELKDLQQKLIGEKHSLEERVVGLRLARIQDVKGLENDLVEEMTLIGKRTEFSIAKLENEVKQNVEDGKVMEDNMTIAQEEAHTSRQRLCEIIADLEERLENARQILEGWGN